MENNEYIVRKTENFIGNKIFSYQFQLLETQIDSKNIYFCLYTNGTNDENTNYSIKKFGFTSFELNSYDDITTFTYENYNNRIITRFTIDTDNIIAIFYINSLGKLKLSFYDFDFNYKGINQEITAISNSNPGNGIFFK